MDHIGNINRETEQIIGRKFYILLVYLLFDYQILI